MENAVGYHKHSSFFKRFVNTWKSHKIEIDLVKWEKKKKDFHKKKVKKNYKSSYNIHIYNYCYKMLYIIFNLMYSANIALFYFWIIMGNDINLDDKGEHITENN